jgi:hypothetical protein
VILIFLNANYRKGACQDILQVVKKWERGGLFRESEASELIDKAPDLELHLRDQRQFLELAWWLA